MAIDPRRLTVLLAIQRAGGILAAAGSLHLTPSAVSQQIARLEKEVGAPVLDRQPSGAVLTPAGRVLAEAAERIESELTDARRALFALQEDVTGTVVIGAFQSIIRTLLAPLIRELEERLPGVEVVLRELDWEDGQRELRTGDIDLLLLEAESPIGQHPPRGTRDVAILDEPWFVVLPAGAPVPATLNDLESLVWLGVDPEAAAHRATDRALSTFRLTPKIAHSYNDYDVAIAMVAGGLGVAMLPSLALQDALPDGVQAVSVPGLGTRQVIARHRTTRSEPRPETLTVLDEIIRATAALPRVAQ
ncbi:LysR family transcriptional regulator [Amycolatopsis acidicola]|uniref:LysR family transcriptional regulator n=1 Tax=Amycolatopsis acidicola TaxID=2596893 RepID=A0A5N0V2H8_9PSEU|nr:LysR family transcriptional regulator [Amycolatopsis acidicola]KAA9159316.1 LysR family transcriptional regulator [Amycolatopsis acidicola]